jgi:hypothetical protein
MENSMAAFAEPHRNQDSEDLDKLKLALEAKRYKADVWRWVIAAVGAVVSFIVIDFGKLQLEQFRVQAENQRLVLNAYLVASESARRLEAQAPPPQQVRG